MAKKPRKPPTAQSRFEDETVLLLDLAVESATQNGLRDEDLLAEYEQISDSQREWFMQHAMQRILDMDANDAAFHSLLRRSGNGGRDKVYTWVRHWVKAFVSDPVSYQERHSH